jgi:uncharacterized radical SAM superfamily protein
LLEHKISDARKISWSHFGRKIRFYVPSFTYYKNAYFQSSRNTFPSISITGKSCALGCSHCGGKLLKTMIPAVTPQKLVDTGKKVRANGAVGCLISGGCLPDGSVPVLGFTDAIAEVKRTGLAVVVHSGLIDAEAARKLKEAGVDSVSIDILGSDETIREVYHLNASTMDYEKSLQALEESGIPFTPHVLIGLHHGELKGELEALKMIAKHKPAALILIVFFPVKGTNMEKTTPPSPETVADVLAESRFMMPQTPIILGCARPKGDHRVKTDVLAVEVGVNAIAFPDVEAIRRSESLGLKMSFIPMCCSLFRAS